MFSDPLPLRQKLVGQAMTIDGQAYRIEELGLKIVILRHVESGHEFSVLVKDHVGQLRALLDGLNTTH